MLELFEDYTYDLTEYEREKLLPLFIEGFENRVGVKRAVTNKQIVERLRKKQYLINDARVRKIINHIRMKNLVPGLMASSRGYYITTDPREIERYVRSLEGRESAIREVRKKMVEYWQTLK